VPARGASGHSPSSQLLVSAPDAASVPPPPPGGAPPTVVTYDAPAAAGFEAARGHYQAAAASARAAPAADAALAAAHAAAALALLHDTALIDGLRAWGPDVVLADTAFVAGPAIAAALSTPLATLTCLPPLDPLHSAVLGFSNDAGVLPQFGTGLGLEMVRGREGRREGGGARRACRLYPRSPFFSSQTFFQRLYNRLVKFVAGRAIARVYERHWKPVDAFVGAPRLGSPESAPRELVHMFNADWAIEWWVQREGGERGMQGFCAAATRPHTPPFTLLQAAPAAAARAFGGVHPGGQHKPGAGHRAAGVGGRERAWRRRARAPPPTAPPSSLSSGPGRRSPRPPGRGVHGHHRAAG
jgi:hypothetical protein